MRRFKRINLKFLKFLYKVICTKLITKEKTHFSFDFQRIFIFKAWEALN